MCMLDLLNCMHDWIEELIYSIEHLWMVLDEIGEIEIESYGEDNEQSGCSPRAGGRDAGGRKRSSGGTVSQISREGQHKSSSSSSSSSSSEPICEHKIEG